MHEHEIHEHGGHEHGTHEHGAPEHGTPEHGTPEHGAPEHAAPEPKHGPTGAGTVMLELGEQVGALLLQVPASLADLEIEISPAQPPSRPRTHAQVRERPTSGGVRYSALYDGLAEGTYTVWRDAETAALTVTVTGGELTTCRWPD